MDAQNVNSGNYTERTVLPNESLFSSSGNACISRGDGGLGLVRGYVTCVGAGKQLVSNSYLSNFSSVLANPRVRRFFSSEPLKKRSKGIISVLFLNRFYSYTKKKKKKKINCVFLYNS